MTLQQLIALLTVQETGSIRAAARSLFQTQAAVTKTIKNLENDIGATLIIREARGVHLTEDGETLALHARHALRELELARDQIRMRQGDQQSAISLAVTPAVMYTVLPECAVQPMPTFWPIFSPLSCAALPSAATRPITS